MRIKCTIRYDGSQFHGYQSQNDGTRTVANTLQDAFLSLGIKTQIRASGRTDKGVHATGQVIDCEIPEYWSDIKKLRNYLNRLCAPFIQISHIETVDMSFHARYSAKQRTYRYFLKVGEVSLFDQAYVSYHDSIDLKRIKSAIALFVGEHDFVHFSKQGSEPKSTVRKISTARFYQYKGYYVFSFKANGYLRSQIRMMVAMLLEISDGHLDKDDLKAQLSGIRVSSRSLAKPNGLYLAKVIYEEDKKEV